MAILAALPGFEEFTEKPRFDPAKIPSPGGSSSSGSSGSAPASSNKSEDKGGETSPSDRTRVIRVVDGKLRIDLLKWGLVPPHSPEPQVPYSTFNAKAETVATSPAYRHAWRRGQRCLVPVEAFFEWMGAKPPKQKYRISVKGQPEFCLAGLWEKWEQGETVLETFTIITTAANELVAEIHDKKRMPVIIAPEDYERWLRSTADVKDLLKSFPSDLMEAVPVGKRIASRDDGPSLFG